MHELSIALSIVDVATEELARQGGERITEVHLKLGPLCGVVREALESAFELACEGSALAGSRLIIQEVPIEIDCPQCGCRRPVESIQEMRCRVCGTLSGNVVAGRELELVALEICDEQTAATG
jgi:hydrogenase nickel incorporation protein HypA/HybF